MPVSVEKLIACLPPYRDEWVMIHPRQTVGNIISEVVEAHDEFAPYYDCIALYFDGSSDEIIADKLYRFLKKNIRYQEETEDDQTTALPTGLLLRGHGDCKHYSGFAGGVLSALNRQGRKIKWCYRFASYRLLDSQPHHVFIVVNPGADEIWIDPTPGADKKQPSWITDKKINDTMALRRNIAGFSEPVDLEFVEIPVKDPQGIQIIAGPQWQLMPIEGASGKGDNGTNPYFSGPFLSLQHFKEDPYSIEGTDWNVTAAAMNAAIAKGPGAGFTVTPEFVKWAYDTNLKGWNFYYGGGVAPGYVPNLPSWYPKLKVTDDLKLVLDRDYPVDDYMNDEIHALTAWAQDLINTHDTTPYPLTPKNLKIFSQGKAGDNLMNEHRGTPFFKAIGKAVAGAVSFVGKGLLKVVGSIPRNSFLALVGLNVFNFAGNMWEKIQAGEWDKIAAKWKKLGGNPEKLYNTIEDGKNKRAEYRDDIPVEQKIGAVEASVIIAAAGPVIAAMLAFIKNPQDAEKVRTVLAATKAGLKSIYPDIDLGPLGFLDKSTGVPIDFKVDPKDDENLGGGDPNAWPSFGSGMFGDLTKKITQNPVPAVSLGAGLFMLLKKQGGILPWILTGYGAYILFFERSQTAANTPKVLGDIQAQTWTDISADGVYRRTYNRLPNGNISVDTENLYTGQTGHYTINML